MLTVLRGSTIIRHGLVNFIKVTPLGYFSAENIILKYIPPLKLYHSIAQTHNFPILWLPKEDYTLNQDVAKSNWMITRLCKEGKISEARKLFDEMPERDVISWSTLISGYIKRGLIKEARALFDRVDAKKNVVTWTDMISGYLKMKIISEAERLFDELPDKNVVTWNTMIDGYIRSDRIDKALSLFEGMNERNVVSWNMVISGLVNCGRVGEAKGLFDLMPIRDVFSWTTMVSGLARNKKIDDARFIFDRMPERNVVSWNAMITGYAKNSRLDEAYRLFEKMPVKDVQSWNTMITGFIQNRDLETASRLFSEMLVKSVVSWTAMIHGYARYGKSEEALKFFLNMKRDQNVKPNDWTFVSVLGACADLAGLGEGMQAHQVISKSVYQECEFVISALINMYSKCGDLMMAKKVFDDGFRNQRDLVSWNSMIIAFAQHGCGKEAIEVFNEMQNMGFKPNDITYVGLLSACSHAGLVNEGLSYFSLLLRDESVKVREDHYTCVVDLYSRAGKFNEALDLIEKIPKEVSSHVWGALLLGCNIYGNAEVKKLIADKLSEMDHENAGNNMLLCNIYASSGNLKEVEMSKMKMKDRRLKKQPGCSWIEVGNKFHVFVVGTRSHRESEAINSLLFSLHKKMKMIGFALLENVIVEDDFSLI